MDNALLLEQASPGQMRVFTFDPGDGTLYRAVFVPLGDTPSPATAVSPHGLFFAFGVGHRSVTGFFFSRIHPLNFGYFCEKMHRRGEGYPTTVYMAWLTLLILIGRALPTHLPDYSDVDAPPDEWYQGGCVATEQKTPLIENV